MKYAVLNAGIYTWDREKAAIIAQTCSMSPNSQQLYGYAYSAESKFTSKLTVRYISITQYMWPTLAEYIIKHGTIQYNSAQVLLKCKAHNQYIDHSYQFCGHMYIICNLCSTRSNQVYHDRPNSIIDFILPPSEYSAVINRKHSEMFMFDCDIIPNVILIKERLRVWNIMARMSINNGAPLVTNQYNCQCYYCLGICGRIATELVFKYFIVLVQLNTCAQNMNLASHTAALIEYYLPREIIMYIIEIWRDIL